MQQLTFIPDDILFLKDGRPMEASRSGSGDHFPNPHVLHSALLAALHRANGSSDFGKRRFGGLRSAGPFPVLSASSEWLMPRPADLSGGGLNPDLFPSPEARELDSSLTVKCGLYPLLSTRPASKDTPMEWIRSGSYRNYLEGSTEPGDGSPFVASADLFSSDHTIGIGMDPFSGTTRKGAFYSAARLRLREGVELGALAECHETGDDRDIDRLEGLFTENGRIRIGGESRVCKVRMSPVTRPQLPLAPETTGSRIKWVLLTPAVFPDSSPREGRQGESHPGGWLPGWVNPESLGVMLKSGPVERQSGESRAVWRKRVSALEPIPARLVAAAIKRPQPITGWKLPGGDGGRGGARSTLLAVPAGSVYYFEAENETAARELAAQLNWHGTGDGTRVINRRSTLFGEKGFGLGVCGTWEYHVSF